MRVIFSFHHVDAGAKKAVRDHFRLKLSRLERLLHPPELDTARLRVVVRGPLDERPRWSLRVVLSVPSSTLVAEAEAYYTVQPPLDAVTEQLWVQLRAYRTRLRRHPAARRGAHVGTGAIAQLPGGDVSVAARDEALSFREFAERHAPLLEREGSRWLEYLEAEGKLPPNRRSVSGIVDESLVVAWERLDDKPDGASLEDWLVGILLEVIDTAVKKASETTPDLQSAPTEDGQLDGDSTIHQWVECHEVDGDESDPAIWEDLLPDRRNGESLRQTTLEEEQEAILSDLRSLPASDRTAFSLYAFEGYECDEIAMMQNRGVSQVVQAVAAARARLT